LVPAKAAAILKPQAQLRYVEDFRRVRTPAGAKRCRSWSAIKKTPDRQDRQPGDLPSPSRFYVGVCGRSSDSCIVLVTRPSRKAASTALPPSGMFGFSSALTAAGPCRNCAGFPLRAPSKRLRRSKEASFLRKEPYTCI